MTGRSTFAASHREFLRRGGVGFFIGDGTLTYRPERILEAYWSTSVLRYGAVSPGVQRIVNPGYNADRGPVTVGRPYAAQPVVFDAYVAITRHFTDHAPLSCYINQLDINSFAARC
jgi:hypothetical protein